MTLVLRASKKFLSPSVRNIFHTEEYSFVADRVLVQIFAAETPLSMTKALS
jgi:hypothetical protein